MASIFRRRDAWRKHPVFQSTLKDSFPGLGRAFAVFMVYVVADETYKFATKKAERVPDLTNYEYVASTERQAPPSLVKHAVASAHHDDGDKHAHH